MSKWLLLVGAILSEVSATLSLKAALDSPSWYVLVAAGYLASFGFLTLVLRHGMALGVAYGIWAALGVALTAAFSAVLFNEPFTTLMFVGMILVMAGVLAVELGSQHAPPAGGPDALEGTGSAGP